METGRVRRKFALKTRKWMEMGLGKRGGGLDWIPKICPVKGSSGERPAAQQPGFVAPPKLLLEPTRAAVQS